MPKLGTVTPIKPYWTTKDGEHVKLYLGNVTDVLARMPEKSIQCVVTSPPYWSLRSYLPQDHELKQYELGCEPSPDCGTQGKAQCGGCFVCSMVAVFRSVYRVLRDDGVLWLNLGDTMSGGGGYYPDSPSNVARREKGSHQDGVFAVSTTLKDRHVKGSSYRGLPSGNLVGIPWRVALALQADKWVLRQDIIWAKPSTMPESVKTRCTKAHEYIFLLTKSNRYYYDHEAIKEKAATAADGRGSWEERKANGHPSRYGDTESKSAKGIGMPSIAPSETGSNKRSVWSVDDESSLLQYVSENAPELLEQYLRDAQNKPDVWRVSSQGYAGAHFATFAPKLITPCVLAGTSEKGCCVKCKTPWRRVTDEEKLTRDRPNAYVKRTGEGGTGNSCANTVAGVSVKTLGWEPGCQCGADEVEPCVVMDPFIGSGTTCVVSIEYGRRSIGIDLSKKYLDENAIPRIVGELMSKPSTVAITPKPEIKPLRLGWQDDD